MGLLNALFTKHPMKTSICAFGLLLLTAGCAYFRAPELQQDPAYLEQQRRNAEGPVSDGSRLAADIVSNVWSSLSQYSDR
jgi:hypothetical protein